MTEWTLGQRGGGSSSSCFTTVPSSDGRSASRGGSSPAISFSFSSKTTSATGSGDHLRSVARRLRRAGAEVRTFHPPTWTVANFFEGRLHDKVLIVDGLRAIAGGRNLSDGYFDPVDGMRQVSGSPRRRRHHPQKQYGEA